MIMPFSHGHGRQKPYEKEEKHCRHGRQASRQRNDRHEQQERGDNQRIETKYLGGTKSKIQTKPRNHRNERTVGEVIILVWDLAEMKSIGRIQQAHDVIQPSPHIGSSGRDEDEICGWYDGNIGADQCECRRSIRNGTKRTLEWFGRSV